MRGSSPQARGTRPRTSTGRSGRGLIPAGAGNTFLGCLHADKSWAHPRRRGEHGVQRERDKRTQGSSPQARGTLSTHATPSDANGLIPAGAGNTVYARNTIRCKWAHPRRRGEHFFSQYQRVIGSGSSPQARGTPYYSGRFDPDSGLIPAGAGNTHALPLSWCRPPAHPRRRGEHCQTGHAASRGAGLIPAGAGNTAEGPLGATSWRAHPRRRGEHVDAARVLLWLRGSSPQARGTHLLSCKFWSLYRILHTTCDRNITPPTQGESKASIQSRLIPAEAGILRI